MTEIQQNNDIISLQVQLESIVAAMNMHINRAEKLAAEIEKVQSEILALDQLVAK